MGISGAAYEQILREYDAKQLAAIREQRFRIQKIEEEIPELSGINSRIASLSADMAVMRIRGEKSAYQEAESERASLVKRKNHLLTDHGYTQEDLKPQYECSLCNDTGYTDDRMCQCMRDRIIEVLYDQSNIREILEKENFNTYTLKYYSPDALDGAGGESPLSIARKALSTAMDFVRNFETSKDNLFISGETGTGKTFLCNCIARAVLDGGFSVIYLSAVNFFNVLADGMFSNERRKDQNEGQYIT